MMFGGKPSGHSLTTGLDLSKPEVIDFRYPQTLANQESTTLQFVEAFELGGRILSRASGGLFMGCNPIVCGGQVDGTGNPNTDGSTSNCYQPGSHTPVATLATARMSAASLMLNATTLWITGGVTDSHNDAVVLQSTEFVTMIRPGKPEMAVMPGPMLPRKVSSHCLLKLVVKEQEETFLLVGGNDGSNQQEIGGNVNVWALTFETDNVNNGAWSNWSSLITPRLQAACGVILDVNGAEIGVSAGGRETPEGAPLASVEVLQCGDVTNVITCQWQETTPIPEACAQAGYVVSSDKQSLIVVAGESPADNKFDTIYQLKCPSKSSCQWTRRSHKLNTGRLLPVVMVIPSTFGNCDRDGNQGTVDLTTSTCFFSII